MKKLWSDEAWEDYEYWQTEDRKILKRINTILKDIDRDPFSGLGKPEPLKYGKQGYWSRHIDEANRVVYKVEAGVLIIVQCRSHYSE